MKPCLVPITSILASLSLTVIASEDSLSQTCSYEGHQKPENEELAAFQSDLERSFRLLFKTRTTEHFAIAYRIDEKKMDNLQHYLESFFNQIYARYFKRELAQNIKIVYFETRSGFSRLTGSNAYGFYRREEKTIFTYGRSGHGTLWHELIHAFLDQNQSCHPEQWFEEGLASFYEMALLVKGQVSEGYTNWRLPALQKAIRVGRVTPLKDFLRQARIEEDFGLAQARFLFCYLWVHQQIVPFVQAYLVDVCPDFQGIERAERVIRLLEDLLGKDLDTINEEFLALARRVKMNQKLEQE